MEIFHHVRRRPHHCLTASGLGLALLAVFAVPAGAQTLSLQSGDNVTVSGAGTHGTYQGQPISNMTSAYTSTASSVGVDTSDGIFTLDSGGQITGPGNALFVGGGTTTINGGTISAMGNGVGGAATGIETYGMVTINGGDLSGNFAAFLSETGSTTQINGGNFSSSSDGLAVFGGNVTVDGGTFSGGPGGPATFVVGGGGVLDLFGMFNGYSSGSTITSGSGTITGTLLDGQAFNDTYFVNGSQPGSKIEFNVGAAPVPEISSGASLGIGLVFLGLVGMAGRRARKVVRQ